MTSFGLETDVVDRAVRDRAVERFRSAGIALPTFAELADPAQCRRRSPPGSQGSIRTIPTPRNLFRVHWYNDRRAARAEVPDHLVLPSAAHRRRRPIIVVVRRPLPDDRRPQGARRLRLPRAAGRHRPVRPDRHRAIWPSTGNYARGGVAISRHHGLPGRGDPARGHEPGALRLARPLGGRPGRRHPHARHREQRQGDLRRLQRARPSIRPTSCSTSSASSATTSPLPVHRPGAGTCSSRGRTARAARWPPSSPPPGRPARSPPATA